MFGGEQIMKIDESKPNAVLVVLQWVVTVTCLAVGSAGVVCLLFTQSADNILAILLIVTGLVALPGLLVGAFARFARGLGSCLGLIWRAIRAGCRTSRLQARPGSLVV